MGAVGKSALSQRFVMNIFSEFYDPTIEDTYSVKIKLHNKECSLSILDTAGQDDFAAMRPTYIRQSQGFILVYAVDDPTSFEQVISLYNEIIRTKSTSDVPITIVGNKCDLEKRCVTKVEGEALAQDMKAGFFETSALTNYNVSQVFMDIAEKCWQQSNQEATQDEQQPEEMQNCCLLI